VENKTHSEELTIEYKEIESIRTKIPIIGLKIITPYKTFPTGWLDALLDTGYDGGLLIPFEIYKKAELQKIELPVDHWDVGEAITGNIILLQTAIGKISIKGLKTLIELPIETFEGCQEILLGLEGIKNIMLYLDGPNQALTLKI